MNNNTEDVTMKHFVSALKAVGVSLSNSEIKYLFDKFGVGKDDKILRLDDMSMTLGLHSNTLTILRNTQDKIKRLKSAAASTRITIK